MRWRKKKKKKKHRPQTKWVVNVGVWGGVNAIFIILDGHYAALF